MREWELKLRIAQSLFFQDHPAQTGASESAPAPADLKKLHSKLFSIYDSLTPIVKPAKPMGTEAAARTLMAERCRCAPKPMHSTMWLGTLRHKWVLSKRAAFSSILALRARWSWHLSLSSR